VTPDKKVNNSLSINSLSEAALKKISFVVAGPLSKLRNFTTSRAWWLWRHCLRTVREITRPHSLRNKLFKMYIQAYKRILPQHRRDGRHNLYYCGRMKIKPPPSAISEVLHLEHSFVWCGNFDSLEITSEVPGKFWNVVPEKDGEDKLDGPRK
jgi:hypothetical protein